MKCAMKRNHVLPFCMVSCQFESCFDRFGARIGKKDSIRTFSWSDFGQFFCKVTLWSVIKVSTGHVQQQFCLSLDCMYDTGMTMAR